MNLYEDMTSKCGFSDGETVSDADFNTRSVYITTLNHLLKKRGSNVRVLAWDRPGMHNPCWIVRVTLEDYKKLGYDAPDANPSMSKPEINGILMEKSPYDEAFAEAEEIARELYLDDYLTQKGTLRKNREGELKAAVAKALAEYDA